jgi:pyrroloquinoline quinone biosynthesis protein D
MSAPADTLTQDSIPRLPHGVRLKHDEARGEWLLLAPERVIKLDTVALAVLQRCTGTASLGAIVDELAKSYNAPRERIDADVRAMLAQLVAKRLVDA